MTDSFAPDASTPPPNSAVVPSKATPEIADLIWEDEPAGSTSWWLSRARSHDLQLFIATDPLTNSFLCLARSNTRPDHYDILVVMAQATDALAKAKHAVAVKLVQPLAQLGEPLFRWKLRRGAKMALNQAPLASSAFLLGALLGLAVALFAISTSLVGWPMLAAGIGIGAASGPLLKILIDKKFKSILGPWGRFWVATLSAAFGALIAAGGLLTLFWS